jgi:hypothetical protein
MKKFKSRASATGNLMGKGNEITEKQLAQIAKYGERVKPLTEVMKRELSLLEAKRDAPFEFGQTAKTYIDDVWLYNKYGHREDAQSKETLKGNLCEQDVMELISKVRPVPEFRENAKGKFDTMFSFGGDTEKSRIEKIGYNPEKGKLENEWVTGIPDIDLDCIDTIEDVKTCWSIRTFHKVSKETVPELYYGQGQSYLFLTGRSKFTLHYGLVKTPQIIIDKMIRQALYSIADGDEENEDYLKAVYIIENNNNAVDRVPIEERVKSFYFERNEDYIEKIKKRVELAREYYATVKL